MDDGSPAFWIILALFIPGLLFILALFVALIRGAILTVIDRRRGREPRDHNRAAKPADADDQSL